MEQIGKKELHEDIQKYGGYILSDGTLNLRHLLPKAYDLLNYYELGAELRAEILTCFKPAEDVEIDPRQSLFLYQYYSEVELDEEKLEEANYIWAEDVFNLFSFLSPEGYYFGESEGDGACIGWFQFEEEDDEEEWEDKGTCDRCGEVIPYDEVYVKNGGFCNNCKN
jgi:hypothetical protein